MKPSIEALYEARKRADALKSKHPTYARTIESYEPGGRYIGSTDSREPHGGHPEPPSEDGVWRLVSTCCDSAAKLIITTWERVA